MAHLAYSGTGAGRLIGELLPDWLELPIAGAVFAGLIIYGVIQRIRNGSPANRPENIAIRKGAALLTVCSSALLEILGVIGIFAFGWPWWAGVAPAAWCVLGVFLLRSALKAGEQHK
ncbi:MULTISPECIES: hypothetical protein [unclassified Streptomyces]|uniref:hypothetical protein n=1 Tax=unclassified Streptomyces TaxID=2593676 RepID=UPI002E1711E5|nr:MULTISPECIES: hypothetical protein [unclassified Streptomyces]